MAKLTGPIVTYLDAEGNEISNDPRWIAQQYLREQGVTEEEEDAAEEDNETEAQGDEGQEQTSYDEEGSEEEVVDYDSLNGKELKALAKERGVDITGLTKVSEVREALRAADEEE